MCVCVLGSKSVEQIMKTNPFRCSDKSGHYDDDHHRGSPTFLRASLYSYKFADWTLSTQQDANGTSTTPIPATITSSTEGEKKKRGDDDDDDHAYGPSSKESWWKRKYLRRYSPVVVLSDSGSHMVRLTLGQRSALKKAGSEGMNHADHERNEPPKEREKCD